MTDAKLLTGKDFPEIEPHLLAGNFHKFITKQTHTSTPKYDIDARIISRSIGSAVIKSRRFNQTHWEYGVLFPGMTTGLMWFRETELRS